MVPITQCDIALERRFAFYDQVHTTGMDIHHTPNARAVLTLGKDMTFRDYAQGAFRMRGIGRGQTLHLFSIPEVNALVAKVAKSPPSQTLTAQTGPALQKVLREVVGWLVVNSMKSETVQFNMLCEQAIYNVFRKNAFKTIQSTYKSYGTKGLAEQSVFALDLFRERLDFSVENAIPAHILK